MKEENTLNSKIKKLDQHIDWFYSDEFNLDEATHKYKETIKLAKEIEKDLA